VPVFNGCCQRNEKGESPLHRACIEGNLRKVKLLIDTVNCAVSSLTNKLLSPLCAVYYLCLDLPCAVSNML